MIQLQRLEGFYWVARLEGYARAARAFPYPITQPGVHQQVRRLESDLGVKLFERVGKDRVILTPAGRALDTFVAPFLEKLKSIEDAIRTGTVGGTLRVHASGHLLRYLLPPWLRRLQSRHPEIVLELVEAKAPDLEQLRSGVADLLVDHLFEVPDDVRVKKLAKARAFVVVAANHSSVKGRDKPIRFDDLTQETFIAYGADRRARELQLQALKLHEIEPKRVHTADSSETILGFVAAGLGYSILPSILPNGPREAGVHVSPLMRPVVEFPIYAVWRRSALQHSLIDAALALAPTP